MREITVRQRVLAIIAKQHRTSASQIGRALNMSASAVRHHLTILSADRRITMIGVKKASARGRPIKEYTLSERTIGDNLAMLSEALLSESERTVPVVDPNEPMAALGRVLVEKMGRIDPKLHSMKRLDAMIGKFNESNYLARWEAGKEGPRILFAHCPYAVIIDKHPELCRMDEIILEETFGVEAHQLTKIDIMSGGRSNAFLHSCRKNDYLPVSA